MMVNMKSTAAISNKRNVCGAAFISYVTIDKRECFHGFIYRFLLSTDDMNYMIHIRLEIKLNILCDAVRLHVSSVLSLLWCTYYIYTLVFMCLSHSMPLSLQ